jgi:hypothetical protein
MRRVGESAKFGVRKTFDESATAPEAHYDVFELVDLNL